MPPKTRNGEGLSKGSSLQPTLSKKQLPPIPRQRRSGGRSGAASVEEFVGAQSSSSTWEVTAPSRRDVPPPKQPHQNKEHAKRGEKLATKRGEKSTTKQGETSTLANSQSHHQANPDVDDDPLLADIRAQNLVIQEKDELIRQLQQQPWERRKAPSPPPRRSQAPNPPPRHSHAPSPPPRRG